VVGPSPGSGEAEAPPRSGSSQSPEVKVVSEPWGRARRSSSSSGAVFLSGRSVERRSDYGHFRLYRLKGA
jgi:hypothetical protein